MDFAPMAQPPRKNFRVLALVVVLILGAGVSLAYAYKADYFQFLFPSPNGKDQTSNNGDALPPGSLAQQLSEQSKIKKFKDYDELKKFIEERALSDYYSGYKSLSMLRASPMAMDGLTEIGQGGQGLDLGLGAPAGTSADDYSVTNIQVAGVDEADLIKNDGKYLYVVSGNRVLIIDAYPAAEAKIVSSIHFGFQPQNLYLNGNRLVVIGSTGNYYYPEPPIEIERLEEMPSETIIAPPPFKNSTYFKVYDVANQQKPELMRDLTFEGNYQNSRMIGDYVYLLTNSYASEFDDDLPLPKVMDKGVSLPMNPSDPRCLCPDVYYFDIPYRSYIMTSLTAINAAADDKPLASEIYLLGDSQQIYVSEKNLYIAYTKYLNEWQLIYEVMKEIVYPKLSERLKDRIIAIEATPNIVLTEEEKLMKIFQILEHYSAAISREEANQLEKEVEAAVKTKYESIADELEKTVIHKIAISGAELKYATYGEVPGNVLNQFSMDENNGYFRIATTRSAQWSQFAGREERQSSNSIFILDSEMKIAGSLKGLARDERIYSVRFLGKRAYVVTFKQIDPLFVIDVSDPRNPSVLGELKVPGFSTYLHPYDENTVIGLGRETAENQWGGVTTKGIKLSLFDVSDVNNLKEIDTYAAGEAGSGSEALNDHKAFLFSLHKNLLVLPVTLYENLPSQNDLPLRGYARESFNGALVFNVNKSGFTLNGRLKHDSEQTAGGLRPYPYIDSAAIRRSRYINDTLYTVSNRFVQANKLDDLSVIKLIDLSPPADLDVIIDEPVSPSGPGARQ